MNENNIYKNIATHFSNTRGYTWPCVRKFLEKYENKNINIYESGCGNGKNMLECLNQGFINVYGSDLSPEFVDICKKRKLDVSQLDILDFNKNYKHKFDIVLCIAVLHHLKTHELRIKALCNIYEYLKIGGTLMVTLWSYEQHNSKVQKKFELGDNIIPWKTKNGDVISNRFYYIYNYENLLDFLDKFKNIYIDVKIEIEYEEQNWILILKK